MEIGDKAPDFALRDQNGTLHDSSEIYGRYPIVLFFYPKDHTPGCTQEVCAFRDVSEDFHALGCKIYGISGDNQRSHQRFATKFNLNYPLLSDKKKQLRRALGVPGKLLGLIPGRVTYVIDKNGIIRHIFDSMSNPIGHTEEALKAVKELS